MASSSDDEFVILLCTNPNPIETVAEHREILIFTTDIQNWDLFLILRYRTVKIQAHRNRLIKQSSYFHSLFSDSFSESNLECVSIQWNLESFVSVLKCIYGCQVDVSSDNFLSLLEASLYFGAEALLSECKNWFSEVSTCKGPGPLRIQLDDLIHIWNFGLEHANDFVPELCVGYLARNFMWAMSSKFFVDVPYKFLLYCVKHPHLTVYSEMHLSDALLVWLNANTENLESSSKDGDDYTDILKQIRVSLWPLWYAAGKRRSCYFSKLADKSIETIIRLMKIPPMGSIDVIGDANSVHFMIRLTEYSKKVDLSNSPQITSAIVLQSLLHPSSMDVTLRKIFEESLNNPAYLSIDRFGGTLKLLSTLSFEAVEEVDISNCQRLHLEMAIECFSKSFPSLRKLKAAHLWNFKMVTLNKLVEKCPLIGEVDLTVDISPILPAQVSVLSLNPAKMPLVSSSGPNSLKIEYYFPGPLLSNITRLTLEGRSDIRDSELCHIAKFCASLNYLNLKGCTSVTDAGISNLISICSKLHSILVCDTSFGINSTLALCSPTTNLGLSPAAHFGERALQSLAHKLQTLHMGGCKGIDERSLIELISQARTLKSLCLRDTCLIDDALYSFSGYSLETLDVSNTMISAAALAYIVCKNPALKCLSARGCKNLIQKESGTSRRELSSSYSYGELYNELGKRCILEEIAFSWGFSSLSFKALKPAIMSLKAITVGLGGSLCEDVLSFLLTTCPMLQAVILYFQVISDTILINITSSLRCLQELALCYCLGDISIASFKSSMPKLRKLRLERVAPGMTNNDLIILTQSCANLIELSLRGCRLLNSDSLHITAHGWPGLTSLRLEDCGEATTNGIDSLFNCIALEELLLRHNGQGIPKNFILDAALKMPMLRQISLDMCDACEGDFNLPNNANRWYLNAVKIARCKHQRHSSSAEFPEAGRLVVHKETLVQTWDDKQPIITVVKERL